MQIAYGALGNIEFPGTITEAHAFTAAISNNTGYPGPCGCQWAMGKRVVCCACHGMGLEDITRLANYRRAIRAGYCSDSLDGVIRR